MRWLAVVVILLLPGLVNAQGFDFSVRDQQRIIVIDQARLYAGSIYGKRLREEFQKKQNLLESQSAQIASELETEERELAEKRATMDAEEFRKLADDFDARVKAIRQEQLQVLRDLTQAAQGLEENFRAEITPTLRDFMFEIGAEVAIDRNTVLYSIKNIDMTEQALQYINAHHE